MEKITIIGLGYVGLPLAIEFAKKYDVVGFDINKHRIDELIGGHDSTLEVSDEELKVVKPFRNNNFGLKLTTEIEDIKSSNIYIVTVPTPILEDRRPNMTPLINASETIGMVIKKGDIVIYESTVYPGATEEVCIPVIEKVSGMIFNSDFFVGYSPERINPGDKINTLTKIKKVTSGSTTEVAEFIDKLYNSILLNGTFKASSIKVAEASKVIENSQRDLNISFVNELALIFDLMDIDTMEVLEAASTKWNFHKYLPGLVGGHCISIDPYYLKWKAEQLGYNPIVISSGRKVNDEMGKFIAEKVIKLMIKKGHRIKDCNILLLGITFKENCPDTRNTKVIDVYRALEDFGCNVEVLDPTASHGEVLNEYNINIKCNLNQIKPRHYQGIIHAVSHKEFQEFDIEKFSFDKDTILYDIKSTWDKSLVNGRL